MTETPQEIQDRMKAIRRHLADDVENVVQSARQMADWKGYVRRYPWACVAAATTIGFLVVPKRVEIVSPDVKTLLELAKKNKLVVRADPTPQKRGGLVGAVLTFAANAAVRGVLAYLGQQAGKRTGNEAAETDQRQA